MNALVIYDSKFGNTRKIAEAIAEFLQPYGQIHLLPVAEVLPDSLGGYDLLVAGCPTQGHGSSPAFHELLAAVPDGSLNGETALIFDTRYQLPRWLTGSAADQIAKTFKRKGCDQVAPPESFFVTAKEGPLVEGEIERAIEWVKVAIEVAGLPAPVASLK